MSNKKSTFQTDLKGEEAVGLFLEKFLYNKLDITNYNKITAAKDNFLTKQHLGIDVEFMFQNKEYIVDEKATLHYAEPIPTFAFELTSKISGEWKPGWLYHNNKATTHYLLAWPKREDVPLNELDIDKIKTVEVMLINRKELQVYLNESCDLNKENIEEKVNEIINENKYGKLHNIHPSSKHYYYYTKHLAETPINIIIQKDKLKELALFHFVIYRNTPYSQKSEYNQWLKNQYVELQNN